MRFMERIELKEVSYLREKRLWKVSFILPSGYAGEILLPNRWQVKILMDLLAMFQLEIERRLRNEG